jgi:hypothetical protein
VSGFTTADNIFSFLSYKGIDGAGATFMVITDRLHFSLWVNSPLQTRDGEAAPVAPWGYCFRVSPVRGLQWLNEAQALTEPSFDWACWLLNYLLV